MDRGGGALREGTRPSPWRHGHTEVRIGEGARNLERRGTSVTCRLRTSIGTARDKKVHAQGRGLKKIGNLENVLEELQFHFLSRVCGRLDQELKD